LAWSGKKNARNLGPKGTNYYAVRLFNLIASLYDYASLKSRFSIIKLRIRVTRKKIKKTTCWFIITLSFVKLRIVINGMVMMNIYKEKFKIHSFSKNTKLCL